MFHDNVAFSGFSVDDIPKAMKFYGDVLGLEVKDNGMGMELKLGTGASVFVYPKPNHEPSTFTILNIEVADIDTAVDGLVAAGVAMEHYEAHEESGIPATDDKGILRNDNPKYGPLGIAWFKDPAGNILSVLQN